MTSAAPTVTEGPVLRNLRDLKHRDGIAVRGIYVGVSTRFENPRRGSGCDSDVCVISGHRIGATTIRVVQQPWIDAPVDALVLSANNHLWLRNASGNAAALHRAERLARPHIALVATGRGER